MRQRPPSITVQISFRGPPTALAPMEQEFLPAVDRELTRLVPVGSRLGHERLPIRFLGGQ
jgi:hypothetical protein